MGCILQYAVCAVNDCEASPGGGAIIPLYTIHTTQWPGPTGRCAFLTGHTSRPVTVGGATAVAQTVLIYILNGI